jgi:MOSC domain-containing protein YiiM
VVFQLGPYAFTEQDVDTTIQDGWALFDDLEYGRSPEAVRIVAPHRAAAEGALQTMLDGTGVDTEVLTVLWGEWRGAMAALRSADTYGPSVVGTVTALFRSDGGVPKAPVETVEVGWLGVEGDRQGDRKNHGRPFQAVCLWSNEVIDSFRAEGHPLSPGLAGENVTLTGLPWERVRPGELLRLGDVLLEISTHTVPCSKNAAWFTGGRFDAMHHRNGPRSRMYGIVLEPGRVSVGDPALLGGFDGEGN